MKLGYAHQANGGLAVAQAVKELLSGERPLVTLVTARKREKRLLRVYKLALARDGNATAVRFCGPDGDPFGPDAYGVTRFDKAPPDPVVVAAELANLLAHMASEEGGEVYRPLEEVNPEHPVVGAFEAAAP